MRLKSVVVNILLCARHIHGKTTDKIKKYNNTSKVTCTHIHAHLLIHLNSHIYCSFVVIKVFETYTQVCGGNIVLFRLIRIQNLRSCTCVFSKRNNKCDAYRTNMTYWRTEFGSFHTAYKRFCMSFSSYTSALYYLYAMFRQSYSAW